MSWRSKNWPCSVGTWSFGLSNAKRPTNFTPLARAILVFAAKNQRLGKPPRN